MATIASLTESLGTLKRNPKLFAVGLLVAIITLPQTAVSILSALLAAPIQAVTFFIIPLVLGGLLGMAYEGRVRPTDFDTFKQIGKDRYVSILAGRLIHWLIGLVFTVVSFVVTLFVVGISFASATSGDPNIAQSIGVVTLVIFAIIFVLFLIVMLFVDLFPAAIVADDVGALEGFKRSVSLVAGNFLPALGYGVVMLIVKLLTAVPILFLVLVVFAGAGDLALGEGGALLLSVGGVLAYFVVATTLLLPFRGAFMMCFYHNHRPSKFE